jgi:hypothetical protein
LAAELGKTLLERNKSLENSIKQQQAIIDDQAQEIEVKTNGFVVNKDPQFSLKIINAGKFCSAIKCVFFNQRSNDYIKRFSLSVSDKNCLYYNNSKNRTTVFITTTAKIEH